MNFFDIQDKAKRDSFLLLIAFSGAMVFNALIVHLFALWITSGLTAHYPAAFVDFITWGIVLAVWLPVLVSSRKRWRDVRNGGFLLAATYGGTFIPDQTQNRQDRELLNVTAEMGIASTQKTLPCFCLRDETNINAFLVGTKEDTVLVVSQGAIDRLSRSELQAMVAHEFGHISNNDLAINMRLLVALSGLNSINKFGQEQITLAAEMGSRIKSRRDIREHDHLIGLALFWLFGVFFRIVGCPLVFSGEIIKAAFSRKREYLADAKAVQYTRDSWSLASALHKASRKSTDAALHGSFANELDHLCFFGPWKHWLFSSLLASHPSPQSRINIISPHFSFTERRNSRLAHESVAASVSRIPSVFEPVVIPTDAASATSNLSIRQLSEQLSIVLSVVIAKSGENEDVMVKNHQRVLKGYTADAHPMLLGDETDFEQELEQALDKLQQQPAMQRKALLEHIQEIIEQDNIALPEERRVYEHILERLTTPSRAA